MARGPGVRMEGQSTWQASRLRGAGLAGHRAWELSSPGAHGLAWEGEPSLFCPDGGAVAQRAAPSCLETLRTSSYSCPQPRPGNPGGHPRVSAESLGASVLTSTSAEGSSLSASHGRLPSQLLCQLPGQARFPYTHSRSMRPCMCVPVKYQQPAYVRVLRCAHTHIYIHVRVCMCVHVPVCARVSLVCAHTLHLHACPCVHVCARVSVYVRRVHRKWHHIYIHASMCACVHVCLCMCVGSPGVCTHLHTCLCVHALVHGLHAYLCASEPMFTHMSTCAYMPASHTCGLVRVSACVYMSVGMHACACATPPKGSVGAFC